MQNTHTGASTQGTICESRRKSLLYALPPEFLRRSLLIISISEAIPCQNFLQYCTPYSFFSQHEDMSSQCEHYLSVRLQKLPLISWSDQRVYFLKQHSSTLTFLSFLFNYFSMIMYTKSENAEKQKEEKDLNHLKSH